jgi:phage host-nuclease inhibitor protein Gam
MAKAAKKSTEFSVVIPTPATDAECDDRILQLGENGRAVARLTADLNASIAQVKSDYEAKAAPIVATIKGLEAAIETYCKSQRARLTEDGKVKSYAFGNGTVSWRSAPPKVTLRKPETILDWLLEQGGKWRRFVRTRYEVDKETMLRFPDLASEIPGVKIGSAGESFTVEPHGLELEQPK